MLSSERFYKGDCVNAREEINLVQWGQMENMNVQDGLEFIRGEITEFDRNIPLNKKK